MNRAAFLKKTDFISGQESKNWRKKLARSADFSQNTIQTLKFRLDCSGIEFLPKFSAYRGLYNAIEGVEKGTLTYFLFSLISCGFRVFASSAEARTYAAREILSDDSFRVEAEKIFGIKLKRFTPEKIILRFQKIPRTSAGRDITFGSDAIYEEYRKFFTNSKIGTEKFDCFLKDLSNALADHFFEWKELKENLSETAHIFDATMKKYGDLPSVRRMVGASSCSLPTSSTIAFDSQSLKTEPSTELNPYVAVSSILQGFRWGGNIDPVSFVQERLLTSNGNGLAWLFSKGIEIFAETPVSSEKEDSLCSIFSVPESQAELLNHLKDSARPLAEQRIFLRCSTQYLSFGDFRSSFAGHINSWISNYIERLLELEGCLSRLPHKLEIPSCLINGDNDFFVRSGLDRTETETIVASFAESKEKAVESLNVLLGRVNRLPDLCDIENIRKLTEMVNRFNVTRSYLTSFVEQTSKDSFSPWKDLKDFLPKDWLQCESEKISKLTGLSGGIPEEEKVLKQCLSDFMLLKQWQQKAFARVIQWGREQDAMSDVFHVLEEKEEHNLKVRPNSDLDVEEQAVRYFLNRVALAVRFCSDEAACSVKKWLKEQSVFTTQREFNEFFSNRKGCIYKSVFSSNRESVLAINPIIVQEKYRLWREFDRLMSDLVQKYVFVSEEQQTVLELENQWMLFKLRCIKRTIPRDVVEIRLPEAYQGSLDRLLGISLDKDEIPVSVFCSVFNLYSTLLKGLCTQLLRNRFFLRTKFCWQKNNSLLYRPKVDKHWRIPERYQKNTEWKEIFASGILQINEDGSVNVAKTFERLHALSDSERSKFSLLLQQLPHEWGCENPFIARNRKAPIKALELRKIGSKGMQLHGRTITNQSFFRLIGPSTHKTQLDQMLLESKRTTIGDMTLLVDEAVKQSVELGNIRLDAEEPMMSLAIPLTVAGRPREAQQEKPPFTHLVGIDQGEAGIAYAVFKLDDAGKATAEAVATGTVRIPSFRRLIKSVRTFRKEKQRTEKFNQRFSSTMFNLRKNVVGDVCHAIVGLMKEFNAFPVLEREVRNLESGSRQLSMVYKAVNAHFLRPEVDAHGLLRKQLWFSAGAWTLPEFIQHWDDLKNPSKQSDDGRPNQTQLHVWPGAAVHAHYTSRICSHCGRNISALIRKAKTDDAYKTICFNKYGEAEIYGETVKLYVSDKEHDGKYYRQRNERVPLTTPLPECELSLKEFERLVKRNLRRPPKSLQSKDTSQSRYFCVFKDCAMHNVEQHADENAAINIGRRFLAHLSKADSKE